MIITVKKKLPSLALQKKSNQVVCQQLLRLKNLERVHRSMNLLMYRL